VQLFAGFIGGSALVPLHFEKPAALDGGPGIVSKDGDTTGGGSTAAFGFNLQDVAHAGNGLGFGGIKGSHFAIENGAAGDNRIEHARHARINTEFRRAVGLRSRVEAMHVVTHDGEVVGIF